eukprot:403347740
MKKYNIEQKKKPGFSVDMFGRQYQDSTSDTSSDSLIDSDQNLSDNDFEFVGDSWGRMRKIKIAKSINDDITFHNFMVYKYVLCQHQKSCFKHMVQSVPQNFIKGLMFGTYINALIFLLEYKNKNLPFWEIIKLVVETRQKLVLKIGLFSASFTFFQKLFQCFQRAYFQKSHDKKFPFVSAFVTAIITLPLFFHKPMRRVMTLMSMTLAFECLFKLMFRYRKPYVNSFQKYYRREIDKVTGEPVNRQITSQDTRRKLKKKPIDDYTHSDHQQVKSKHSKLRKWLRKVCEFLVAALLSVVIQTVSFESQWKNVAPKEDIQSGRFDYFNYFFRNLLMANEDERVQILFRRISPNQ